MKLLDQEAFLEELKTLLHSENGTFRLTVKRGTNPPRKMLKHKRYADYSVHNADEKKSVDVWCLIRAKVARRVISVHVRAQDVSEYHQQLCTVLKSAATE